MPPIITITFSPCIDKSTSIAQLLPEKKLQCASPVLEPGGGGINVARAIKKLGGTATAIFPSGGYTGKFFNHLLNKEEISSVIIESENETRENIVVFDQSSGKQYRFGMPGTPLLTEEWNACLSAIEKNAHAGYIIASGSLPPGVPLDIYARIARIAKKNDARLIIDTSGEALKHAVEEGVFLVKPNLGELSYLANRNELRQEEIGEVAAAIIAKGKCEVLVISMGAAGAMLVTKNTSTLIAAPKVVSKSTVGAGDSMLAGITFYLSKGNSIFDSVRYGVACGSAATMNPGTELCRKEDVERLFKNQLT